MVKLLHKFTISMAENTRLEPLKGDLFFHCYKDMYIHVKPKDD